MLHYENFKNLVLTFKGTGRQLFLLRPITAAKEQTELPTLPNKIAFKKSP